MVKVFDIILKWFWIVKHACRTLLKAGHPEAMAIFGFGAPCHTTLSGLELEHPELAIRETQTIRFQMNCTAAELCRLEYAVTFAKAKGKTSRKVFKISEKTLAQGTHEVVRKQKFADLSTRRHYPGAHSIAIIINGHEMGSVDFQLTQ